MSKRTLSQVACVYVIGALDGPQKIGISDNPLRRLAAIRTSNPVALMLHQAISMTRDEAMAVEAYAHWLLRERLASGEWFAATPEYAIAAVCESIAAVQSGAAKPPEWRLDSDGFPVPGARLRGCPRKPNAGTRAERAAASRKARGMVTMDLPREVAEALDALAVQYGLSSRLAVVMHLLALAS